MTDPRKAKAPLLSAVVPVYNEGALAQKFIEALHKELKALSSNFEIVVVDDGSTDDTVEHVKATCKKLPVKLVAFARNFGKEKAITAGLHHVSGDAVLIIDADFQHPLDMIKVFFGKWREGFDNVYGVREHRKDQSFLNRFFSKSFYKLHDKMVNIDMPANAGDFRILDRRVVDAVNLLPEANRFMKGLYAWVGFKGCGVPYEVVSRAEGKTKFSFFRLLDLAITGITSFSDWPLRVWSLVGFVISFLALIYGIIVVVSTLVSGSDVPGWATLVAGIAFLGGVQLLSIGIIGEYVARIFREVKGRPTYIVGERVGFDEE
jgi:glycosyltransferase involved in cell wall biosynthesis